MSQSRPLLFSFALILGLSMAAGAAPKRPAVPALPPLNAPAPAATPAPDATPAADAPPPVLPGATGTVQATLYDGKAPDDAGLTLAAWGGGSVQDDTAQSLDNGHSLQITTVDDYQGGKITFNAPVSLGDMTGTRFLQVTLRFPKAAVQPTFGGGYGRRFGRRGRFGRGGFGGNGTDNTPPEESPTPLVTSLRWVLTLADGRQAEVRRPLPELATNGQNWVTLAVPLSALKFPAGAASPLQSLTIAADGYSQFSVGAIQIVSDDTPITANLSRPQDTGTGENVLLHCTADAGPSALRYTWNFGTGESGVEQAEGQTVQTQYNTAGTYTITVTVTDVDGVKKPATATATIHVR